MTTDNYEKLRFLEDLVSGRLELGSIDLTDKAFARWLKKQGYRDFGASSWQQMKKRYKNAGKPLESLKDIALLKERMQHHKEGRLILARAATEVKYGHLGEDEKWRLHKEAERSGFCPLCGWKDGDGVKVCYYSQELGAVTHRNSWNWVMSQMTESQRSLVKSYDSHQCGVMDEKTCNLVKRHLSKLVRIKESGFKKQWQIGCVVFSFDKYKTPDEVAEAWIGNRRSLERYLSQGYKVLEVEKQECKKGTAYEGLGRESIYIYTVQKPHLCGGFARFAGPYHFICPKCKEEVKLWEFGRGRETVPKIKISLFEEKEKTMKRWSAVVKNRHTTIKFEVEAVSKNEAKKKAKEELFKILEELHLAQFKPLIKVKQIQ